MINPIELTRALVRRPSVTPTDAGALDLLLPVLSGIGFRCRRLPFSEPGYEPVDNLFARWGKGSPAFCFAGHTDVVPAGDETAWTRPPFGALLEEGMIWGRGAADMKGAIAAFAAAAERVIARRPSGSIVMLITGDEEGPAVNGTRKLLKLMANEGEHIDHCVVGEPSSHQILGDMIKVGRRGSMNCRLTAFGVQGHVAYPEKAANPIPLLLKLLRVLSEGPLDDGFAPFPPSSLQITDLAVGNPVHNVIPARAAALFNVRFNPALTGASLEQILRDRLDEAGREAGARYELDCVLSGEAFLTTDEAFIDLVASAAEARTGRFPERSTTGGTSDGRFIKDFAPVVECGLVGATIHKVDEHAPADDIVALAGIYEEILTRYFRIPIGAS